jgi:ABC-type nickel/cobalt efflux system permease component RcnA
MRFRTIVPCILKEFIMTGRKRIFALSTMLIVFLIIVPAVAAHPLGNFTVSRYSKLTAGPRQIHLLYVVDMAEIPTFQERQIIDMNSDGSIDRGEEEQYLTRQTAALAENLHLAVNGQPATWSISENAITFPPGQGDLPTLRLEMALTAVLPSENVWQAEYNDQNYAERLGWQEVVVTAEEGVQLLATSVPAQDVTDELRTYPQNLLQEPLAVNQAQFQFAPRVGAGRGMSDTAVASVRDQAVAVQDRFGQDQFADLLTGALDSPAAIAAALLLAAWLGAAHALTPGHGKTIVGAYLVGSRGTARHALFLGLTTTITHTAGVFTLGFIVLFASRTILPEQLYPWLGVLSGLLLVFIGISLFRQRLLARYRTAAHEDEEGYHTHFGVRHKHVSVPTAVGWRNLLALGVSGGLIPCPSALILLLSAIALGQVAFGLVLIIAFSLGLAAVLTGIGLALVYTGRLFARLPMGYGRIAAYLPIASALFITLVGIGITLKAVTEL